MVNAVQLLTDAEYDDVWSRFNRKFCFRPGMERSTWPAINEPHDSITWSLVLLEDESSGDARINALTRALQRGLSSCTPANEFLFFLDWHHDCFRLKPEALMDDDAAFAYRAVPDGDYSVFADREFRLGTFGHPWESTICIFGSELLEIVSADVTTALGASIRIGGNAAST